MKQPIFTGSCVAIVTPFKADGVDYEKLGQLIEFQIANGTENLQLRATLEPVRDFKIDLSATRTMTTQKSIQYMYEGTPTTQSGTFQMTTISLSSAFEGIGNANSGYRSRTFEKFVNSLDGFRQRVKSP